MLPVFGTGETRFQPVYAGDIGNLVEILTRPNVNRTTDSKGKIIEAAGPDSEFPFVSLTPSTEQSEPHSVLTFRQIMKLVVDHTGRFRPIVALPWVVGQLQAAIMRLLPASIFTITPDQVRLIHKLNG